MHQDVLTVFGDSSVIGYLPQQVLLLVPLGLHRPHQLVVTLNIHIVTARIEHFNFNLTR